MTEWDPVEPRGERMDEEETGALYAEFAHEDNALAEAGLVDYVAGLNREDAAHAEDPWG